MISRLRPVAFTASLNASSSNAFIEVPVDRLDAVELGQDRRKRRPVEAGADAHGREHDRQVERLGRLGQQADVHLDEVGARLRADDLEHLLLVVDQHQRAVVGGPDTEIVRHRFSPLRARMRLRSVGLEFARQDARGRGRPGCAAKRRRPGARRLPARARPGPVEARSAAAAITAPTAAVAARA